MFVLRISVTPSAVEHIKAELTRDLAEVKSSHRVEAIGRGLGFRSYAALRAVSQQSVPPAALVTGGIFSAYLTEHGFPLEATHFYLATARVAIRNVLDAVPRLHIHGIGFGRRATQCRWHAADTAAAICRVP